MKKALYVFAVLALCMMSACGLPKAEMADAAVSASEAATAEPATAQDAFADATADELRGMIARYQNEGDFEMVYKTARTLIEREPSDTGAYTAAMDALAAMSAANYEEINALLAQGVENAQDTQALADWAEDNQPDYSVDVPHVKKDPSQIESISELGFVMDSNTNLAYYSEGAISVTINHAEWGATPNGYELEVNAVNLSFQADGGYYLITGYYPDAQNYALGIADENSVLATYFYDPKSGAYEFTNGDMESTEQVLGLIFPDAGNVMKAPVSFYNDTLMDVFGLGAEQLYALPFEPLTLPVLGFRFYAEEGRCLYVDMDNGADVEIYRDDWKMQTDEWKKNVMRFYKVLDGYYLEIAYYPYGGIVESHMYEGEESNDYGVQSYIKYDLTNGVLLDAVAQNSDLQPAAFFAGALGIELSDAIFTDVFAQLETYVEARFGMTPDALFAMDAK